MNDILSNQHVRRRKSPPKKENPRTPPVFHIDNFAPRRRDAGEFISRLRQKPLRQKGFHQRRDGEKNGRSRISLAFSIPLLPVACFCMLLGGAILAFSGRGNLSTAWMDRDVISGENSPADYDLALYTGVTPRTEEEAVSETALTLAPVPQDVLPSPQETTVTEDIPLDLAETFSWKTYTVLKGDSVSRIAAAHSLSMDAVIASNDLTNARLLRVGEILRLPNMDGIPYQVKKGDSLSKISKSMGVPMEAIVEANDLQRDVIKAGETIFIPGARMRAEDLKLALGELFAYPVSGARLTSPYGWRNDPISGVRRHHAAIDLAAPTGTTVKAASAGTVLETGYHSTYGNFIILGHGSDYQTMYAHLSKVSVQKSGRVAQGDKIGEVGSTGYSTGPHLHFSVYKNGQAVNPLDYLRP